MENLISLWVSSGVAQIEFGQIVMMGVGLGLLFLAINKGFEPLLLVPIGFGTVLANIIYAVNYNILRIMSGMGGLAYSN